MHWCKRVYEALKTSRTGEHSLHEQTSEMDSTATMVNNMRNREVYFIQ